MMKQGKFLSEYDADTVARQEYEVRLRSGLIEDEMVHGYDADDDDELQPNHAGRVLTHINYAPRIYRTLLEKLRVYIQEYFGLESSAMLGEDFLIQKKLHQLSQVCSTLLMQSLFLARY